MKGACLTAAGPSLQDWHQYQVYLAWVKMAKEISTEVSLPACVVPVLHPHCERGAVASWELAGKSWGSLEFMELLLFRV